VVPASTARSRNNLWITVHHFEKVATRFAALFWLGIGNEAKFGNLPLPRKATIKVMVLRPNWGVKCLLATGAAAELICVWIDAWGSDRSLSTLLRGLWLRADPGALRSQFISSVEPAAMGASDPAFLRCRGRC
jgi:hypothetical protein